MMTDNGTLHRGDEGGPTADIECAPDGTKATATWIVPDGQLLKDHPELGTGGYAYFTEHATPTETLRYPSQYVDFSGALSEDSTLVLTAEIESGVEYRAHILLAYETGEVWHNDTVFVCEEVVQVSSTVATQPETLPFTGVDPLVGYVAAVMLVVGIVTVKIADALIKENS